MEEGRHDFAWDVANTRKCQKHGVSTLEIEFLFMHEPAIYPDPKHSGNEIRYFAVGINNAGRTMFVVFTYRQRDGTRTIRPISARYMHKKEIDYYKSYEL